MTETENKGPAKKFRAGGIKANVWKNAGETGEYYTVSLERSYKDKQGNWKSTSTLRVNDIPRAALVLEEAFRFAVMHREGEVV